jgi:hypothetical protein
MMLTGLPEEEQAVSVSIPAVGLFVLGRRRILKALQELGESRFR